MRLLKNIRLFLYHYRLFFTSTSLCALSFFACYSLYVLRGDEPSLWFIDSARVILWPSWLRATFALALVRLAGLGAVIIPFILLHAGVVTALRRWKREWDRALALGGCLIGTSMLAALSSGVWWAQMLVGGGWLGRFFVHHMPIDSRWALLMGVIGLLCASLLIVTRLSFVTIVARVGHLLMAMIGHRERLSASVQRALSVVHVAWQSVASGFSWIVGLITGRTVSNDPELMLDPEHAQQLPTLAALVEDAVWHTDPSIMTDQPAPQDTSEQLSPVCLEHEHQDIAAYTLPHLELRGEDAVMHTVDRAFLHDQARILEQKLASFDIAGSVTDIKVGPIVVCFEYAPTIDTKLSRIIALEHDLALALQAESLRILAPIPGMSVVGFEIPHKQRASVPLARLLTDDAYRRGSYALPLVLGVDTVGKSVIADLARMPHLLMAGATGSGKSVALNSLLISLLCSKDPDELKLILIDPKRIELPAYADIAHLLFPVITEALGVVRALQWVVRTMEERYTWLAHKGVRSIADYHEQFGTQARRDLPYIVVVIDELADLMMTNGQAIERLLVRIAQMARAAGIHLIVATQRPSVDVITGLIKVNFPSRIAFRVTSKVDSRIILDVAGAEQLLGRGDMLFSNAESIHVRRIHGAYVADRDIAHVSAQIRAQRSGQHLDLSAAAVADVGADLGLGSDEALYQEVLAFLKEVDEVSISLLQRKFKIGFNRSARLIELLEQQGRVITMQGEKTRKVVRLE